MLKIITPEQELFNEETGEFIYLPSKEFILENSLKAIAEWETIHNKPFFEMGKTIMWTSKELVDYIKCMDVSGNMVDLDVTDAVVEKVNEYLAKPATATTINNDDQSSAKKIVTTEVIYAYMAIGSIPFDADTWNIERLMTLINAVGEINNPNPKKMSQKEVLQRNYEINEARKAKYNSKG